MRRSVELLFALTLGGALVGWQLFFPPIVGLADQGDFQKVLGPLGYAPVPPGPEHKYYFVTREYVQDPSYRQPRFEQLTSELVIAKAAIALHNLFRDRKTFDITLFGWTHATLFLLALARLFYVTRVLAMYRIIWALMLLVLTDAGYVAYWNSLYTEPASCIWFLFLLAESITFSTSERITIGAVLRWNIFAILWIMAKTQNAPLCVPLGVYGLVIAWRALDGKTRWAAIAGVLAMLAAGAIMVRSILPAPKVITLYDGIFYGILPDSPDPRSDLMALGLNPDYARYSGTLPWDPESGIADGYLVNALLEKITPVGLVEFYMRRPGRMWRHFRPLLPSYFSLRPEFCGNFVQSTGRPPGARSYAIGLWSRIHERVLSRVGLFLLAALVLGIAGGVLLLIVKRSAPPDVLRWTELGTCLAACCLTAFLAAAFGDTYDNTKHQFLFNLLLDTCLVFVSCSLLRRGILRRR
ncbi:MAG: hypothetical protein ABSF22_01790 [Bryobacteraceae bacterium]